MMRAYAVCLSLGLCLALATGSAGAQEPFVVLHYGADEPALDGHHVIARGETLSGILRRYFGTDADLAALIRDTVRRNPRAFRGGDAGLMLAGQTLVLPLAAPDQVVPDAIYFF